MLKMGCGGLWRFFLFFSFFNATADTLQNGKLMDPCIPRGYTHDTGSGKLSPGSLAEKSRYLSALQPGGNFSECRSASLMLLQKDKGMFTFFFYEKVGIWGQLFQHFLKQVIDEVPLPIKCREMLLYKLLCRINIYP